MDEKHVPSGTRVLFIDPAIEQSQAASLDCWKQRVLVGLQRLLPIRLTYRLPLGRPSVEEQLRRRTIFPRSEWEAISANPDQAQSVCQLIAQELAWPNAYFSPADPLKLVLLHGYDDLALAHFGIKLNRQFKVTAASELAGLVSKDATLGELVKLVQSRSGVPVIH